MGGSALKIFGLWDGPVYKQYVKFNTSYWFWKPLIRSAPPLEWYGFEATAKITVATADYYPAQCFNTLSKQEEASCLANPPPALNARPGIDYVPTQQVFTVQLKAPLGFNDFTTPRSGNFDFPVEITNSGNGRALFAYVTKVEIISSTNARFTVESSFSWDWQGSKIIIPSYSCDNPQPQPQPVLIAHDIAVTSKAECLAGVSHHFNPAAVASILPSATPSPNISSSPASSPTSSQFSRRCAPPYCECNNYPLRSVCNLTSQPPDIPHCYTWGDPASTNGLMLTLNPLDPDGCLIVCGLCGITPISVPPQFCTPPSPPSPEYQCIPPNLYGCVYAY